MQFETFVNIIQKYKPPSMILQHLNPKRTLINRFKQNKTWVEALINLDQISVSVPLVLGVVDAVGTS